MFGATGPAAATQTVLAVINKQEATHTQFVQSLQNALAGRRDKKIELKIQSIEGFDSARAPALIVTAGIEAARRVASANPPAPVLYTLLSRTVTAQILGNPERVKSREIRDSAIYSDQPLSRQMDLLRIAMPERTRIGAILGPATHSLAKELRTATRERSLKLKIATVNKREELLTVLDNILDACDVLLTVPDPLIYHGEIIHHLMLTTYRHRIPVIGLSKAYVDTGALLAVYSTPEQIGRQVGEIAAALPTQGEARLPPPQYPRYFALSVNSRVAASLNITLDSENVLLGKLESMRRP